ncbi:potassium/proton antiporter [Salinispirillum marinum]|uniref:Potassium/proton antiporter n=2 Tax=Saccharospirillaceae TaxID=255527 RepID=A0ABV8BEV0_9GAMM
MEISNFIILGVGLLFVISILASVLSSRLGAPLLLVFLIIGMALGEDGFGLTFQDVQTAHLIGSVALAIILFDGGLNTQTSSFRVGLRPAISLATLGVLITAGITGVLAAVVLGLPLIYGLLMGAIVGSTDAAAVFSLLHTAKLELKQRVGATLEIESGSNDPMAIFLTIVLIELILTGNATVNLSVIVEFIRQMGLGGLLGVVGGLASARLINGAALSTGLYPLLAMASGLVVFGVTAVLGGSGFLAVYLAGIVLSNRHVQSAHNILRFHNGLAWMSQIIMFLMLGLLVTPTDLLPTGGQALLIAIALIFIARPIAVVVSLLPFQFSWQEQAFISWVGLRGAVPIILAIFPLLAGIMHADILFNVAFFVVLVSLVVQGWSLTFVARWLKVEIPPNNTRAQRMELELPGQPDYELVGYRISEDSSVFGRQLLKVTYPDGVKPALVLRHNELMSIDQAERYEEGDSVYLATPRAALDDLDRLFVAIESTTRLADKQFFGEFVINGDIPLQNLSLMYGFVLPENTEGLTLHEFLRQQFNQPVVGDRVDLGSVQLVVREMEGDRCAKVGLKLVL